MGFCPFASVVLGCSLWHEMSVSYLLSTTLTTHHFLPVENSSIFNEMSETLWKDIVAELRPRVGQPNYMTWLKPTRLADIRGGLVVIAVPNPYAKNWLEKNLLKDIRQLLSGVVDNFEEVQFEVQEAPTTAEAPIPPLFEATPVDEPAPALPESFFSKYTFDNFIVGNNSRLAFAAAQVVAEKPGEAYNPLFIYGGVGLGKTHLMHAIANEILRRNPRKKIIYTSCETFTSEFIHALQTKTMNDFKKKYRSVDVFLVDDIQFLANKEGTQEEFFHTFNNLHQTNRQIVVTADRMPKEIASLEDRLVSRFGWGMIADIQTPNYENRLAILQAKSGQLTHPIPADVLGFIASTVTSNVRELEGSLTKLVAAAQVEGVDIDKEFAQRCLKDIARSGGSNVSPKNVIKTVADHFSIDPNDILGKKRVKELVYPRQIVMYLLRHKLNHSYPQIGDELGGKDHTTIMYGVNKIEKELKTNTAAEADVSAITQRLG